MTGLRTIWGVSWIELKEIWTDVYRLFDETSSEIRMMSWFLLKTTF
jgi:hypothetical protein